MKFHHLCFKIVISIIVIFFANTSLALASSSYENHQGSVTLNWEVEYWLERKNGPRDSMKISFFEAYNIDMHKTVTATNDKFYTYSMLTSANLPDVIDNVVEITKFQLSENKLIDDGWEETQVFGKQYVACKLSSWFLVYQSILENNYSEDISILSPGFFLTDLAGDDFILEEFQMEIGSDQNDLLNNSICFDAQCKKTLLKSSVELISDTDTKNWVIELEMTITPKEVIALPPPPKSPVPMNIVAWLLFKGFKKTE